MLENKAVFTVEHKDKILYRRSFYRGEKALNSMKDLILNKYKIPELIIDEEKLNRLIQKLNPDKELINLAREKLSKHTNPRKISRIFNKSEPLVDLINTYPRTITRLNTVVDMLWEDKTEDEDILLQLAFKEVMASDICEGREETGLIKKYQI